MGYKRLIPSPSQFQGLPVNLYYILKGSALFGGDIVAGVFGMLFSSATAWVLVGRKGTPYRHPTLLSGTKRGKIGPFEI